MPRHKSTESTRIAGAVPAGEPAFYPQEDFPQGVLQGDLVQYNAETEEWERVAKEDVVHDPATASAPIHATGQALSIVNDKGETVTEIDTGSLSNSEKTIPSSKTVSAAIAAGVPRFLYFSSICGALPRARLSIRLPWLPPPGPRLLRPRRRLLLRF